ncbi:MAG TPA: SpoIIE family protein phosphatase [Rhodocyclaceae bacterium]|nr:SpoIIE family protein phosphatase [Rhodocyclaceae bacterium]
MSALSEEQSKASAPASRSLSDRLLAPTVWLSGRLSFSRKYLLIGIVVFVALALLCAPLLKQSRESQQIARVERQGLALFVVQSDALAALVVQRSRAVAGDTELPPSLGDSMDALVAQARRSNMGDQANRLETSWRQASTLGAQEAPQQRFAALTGAINALLGLMRENARTHRLNVDHDLDATSDMLSNRLPLVLETLGKQQDALTLNTGEMASYAVGAQVVLAESISGLKAGVAQLAARTRDGAMLTQSLGRLLDGIGRQQDAADKALDDPKAIAELHKLATSNLQLADILLKDAAAAADDFLASRIADLERDEWVIAALLVGAVCAIAYLFAGIYFSTLRSLKSLSEGTAAFCSGHLDTRVKIDTQDELVLVAGNFNTIASEVERLLEVIREQNESRQRELETLVQIRTAELADKNEQLLSAGERVNEELNLARNMQLAILPHNFPDESDWSVHAAMFPARELGGDFYDCFPLSDGRYGILVADVSGKGVGAAFFMAVSRTVILDLAMTGRAPSEVFVRANDSLCERNPMELFVTACYAIYDPRDGSLIYANAGHHPPLLRKASGHVQTLPCVMDTALGVMPGLDYSDERHTLAPGDTLLLYTDGVTEAFSNDNEAYGDDRLHAWFSAAQPSHGAAALNEGLVRDVADFVRGAEASDDLTCLVLCRKQRGSIMDTPHMQLRDKTLLLDYQLPSKVEEIAKLAEAIDQALPDRPDLAFSANLCLEELITNTIVHGLKGAPDRTLYVQLNLSDEWLEIVVKDDAPPFDPFADAPVPDTELGVDERSIGGLGVHLVKSMMDESQAYYDGSGNLIVLLKTLKQEN